jgi:putative hydrolase of the HAD superfamily
MKGPTALILDFGGVLAHPQPERLVRAMADRLGVPLPALEDAYWRHRARYDRGLTAAEYWCRVLETLDRVRDPRDDLVAELIELDVASWTTYRDEVWQLARGFRERGGRTALLSNGVPEVMARVRADRDLNGWFDVVIVSYEVGLAKPDPRIYRRCLEQLKIAPEEALFVDDRADNVEAAARLDLRVLHFTGPETIPRLRGLLAENAD